MDLQPKKVLIAEDDILIREAISDILEMNGCQVFSCRNGLEALESFEHFSPDLVISDIMMPVMDGFSFLEEYQKIEKSYPPVPFIFLTAMSDNLNCRKGMNLGADDFLAKPFSNEELLNSIQTQYTKFHNRWQGVITEQKNNFERQAISAREEKVVLLKEIHHRVKHNFALLYAFLELEDCTNKESYRESIKSKVMAIASVHEEAYSSKMFTKVNIYKLIEKILSKVDINKYSKLNNQKHKIEIKV